MVHQPVLTNLSAGDWAAIATAVGTLALALVAALQDVIRSWIRRPDLKMTVQGAPPDCHKTRATFQTPAGIDSTPCYYFRIAVENVGRTEAREVEVFAASLTRKRANDEFEKVDRFTPMNLLWSHFRTPFLSVLSPKMPKFCDLGHIHHPNVRNIFGHTLPGVTGNVMAFDLQVEPNMKGHLIGPGTYRLKLVLGAANAKPKECEIELIIDDEWRDDESAMLSDGFGMKML